MSETAERAAMRGEEFVAWKNSPVGKEVYRAAQEAEIEALSKLVAADPEAPMEIVKLQTAARVPAMAVKWIEGIILYGREAAREIEMEDIETGRGVDFRFRH